MELVYEVKQNKVVNFIEIVEKFYFYCNRMFFEIYLFGYVKEKDNIMWIKEF